MTEFYYLLHLIAIALIVGVSTFGLSSIVALEAGPAAIFERIKYMLLPQDGRPELPSNPIPVLAALDDVNDFIEERTKSVKEYQTDLKAWVAVWSYDPWYERTFKGTLYGVLDCIKCLGGWVALGFTILLIVTQYAPLLSLPIGWFGGYGVHRFLITKLGRI